jgi:fibronectin type 3 domain-containing protein
MNEILKLLGTKYSMEIHFDPMMKQYVVTVTNKDKKSARMNMDPLNAETGNFDLLAANIERCIYRLK